MKILAFNQTQYVKAFKCLYGDCFYIEFENGENMLIDSGTHEVGPYITEWLLGLGVDAIDYFVLTHLHEDHSGGFASVIEKISIGKVLSVEYGYDNAWADPSFAVVLSEHSITPTRIRVGDDFKIGDTNVEVLWPLQEAPEKQNLNTQSLVLKITEGRFSALFAADVHEEIEEQLVKLYGEGLKSTFFKVPHHGRDATSAIHLVDAVKPLFAYVSHYSYVPEVEKRFGDREISLYSPKCGTVTIEVKENTVRIYSDSGCDSFSL